jgi:hypothetical protein
MLHVHTKRETVKMKSDVPLPFARLQISLSGPACSCANVQLVLIILSSCPARVRVAGRLIFCQEAPFQRGCVVEFRSRFDLTALGSQSRWPLTSSPPFVDTPSFSESCNRFLSGGHLTRLLGTSALEALVASRLSYACMVD